MVALVFPVIAVLINLAELTQKPQRKGMMEKARERENLQRQIEERRNLRAIEIGCDIIYFYDQRSGLCYALLPEKGKSGPSLTVVPYHKVKHLLVNPPEEE